MTEADFRFFILAVMAATVLVYLIWGGLMAPHFKGRVYRIGELLGIVKPKPTERDDKRPKGNDR